MVYYCNNCDKWWNHPIKRCIFCGEKIIEVTETNYNIIGFTQVFVPSTKNKKVPYFNYLLEDRNKNKLIIKSFNEYEIGDKLNIEEFETKKKSYNVGVVGTGQMGRGISEFMLINGHQIIIKTRKSPEEVLSKIKTKLSKKYTQDQITQYEKNLEVTADFGKLKNCDIIIEAVPEEINMKKNVFQELSNICNPQTIFATNTSSISINKLSQFTDRPTKFVGMHFFNPVHRMDLIEVVTGNQTSNVTKNWIINFSKELNKNPVLVRDSPGFIVNRLLLPQINEAVILLEKKIAKKEEIDSAMKLGLNHPMGPFQLADFIGIDICMSILKTMYQDLGDEKFKPAVTLQNMVKNGKLGLKTGEGFYKY